MRILIFLALLLFPFAAQGQTVPDLSDAAIGYQAEMILTGNPQALTCTASITGPSPFDAPDWQRCEISASSPSWQITHDMLSLAICDALKASFIVTQKQYEKDKTEAAGLTDPDMQYDAKCQCKGGGTTGC